MGVTGEGEVEATAEGLKVTGIRKWRSGGAVGCIGFLVGAPVAVGLGIAAGVAGGGPVFAVVGGVVGCVALVLLGKKLSPDKTEPFVIPWNKVGSLELDGPHVSFVSRGKPAGQVWFWPKDQTPLLPPGQAAQPPNAVALRRASNLALINEIRSTAEAHGTKLSGSR